MTNNNLKTKYRLLVLLDLSQESEMTLRSAINLAKVINGSIEFFYIKAAVDVVKSANQLSAISAIDKENYTIEKEMKSLVNLASQEIDIPIKYSFKYGNVKREIAYQLEKFNPDIVVIGKRNIKPFNFLGNDVTQFLLNNFSGNIFIAGEGKMLESNKEISIGIYNDILDGQSIDITKKLNKQNSNPVKFFRFRKNSETNSENVKLKNSKIKNNFEHSIEYVFEQGSNAVEGLVNYISKNNIDILCMERVRKQKNQNNSSMNGMPEVQKVIHKLNIPLLITQDRAIV